MGYIGMCGPKGQGFSLLSKFWSHYKQGTGKITDFGHKQGKGFGKWADTPAQFFCTPRYVAYIREHPRGFKPLTSLESSVERHIFFSHCWLLRSPTPMKFSMTFHMGGVGVFVLSKFNSVPTCFIHFCSYGSQSIPSPFHLSWLCLVEYLDLFTDEEVSYQYFLIDD